MVIVVPPWNPGPSKHGGGTGAFDSGKNQANSPHWRGSVCRGKRFFDGCALELSRGTCFFSPLVTFM